MQFVETLMMIKQNIGRCSILLGHVCSEKKRNNDFLIGWAKTIKELRSERKEFKEWGWVAVN